MSGYICKLTYAHKPTSAIYVNQPSHAGQTTIHANRPSHASRTTVHM